MFGLPVSTEMKRQLPKKAIYEKFNLNTVQKSKFDADVSRIDIVAEVSPATTAISVGEKVKSIFVLLVTLKNKSFDEQNIKLISKLINQNLVFVLVFEDKAKLGVYHNKLIQTEWTSIDDVKLSLNGLNLDYVYENIITQIGNIHIEDGATLDEQIATDEQKAKIQRQIEKLQRQEKTEKQPKRKFELHQEIIKLKNRLGSD